MTVTTVYGRKVLLCFAVRQTQQPADQKKEEEQEHTEYGHTSSPQMELNGIVQEFFPYDLIP
jgi:hypothetical protein